MGASESTSRSNGTKDKEEEGNTSSAGSSIATAAAVAAGAVAVGWSISKMLSDNTDTEQTNRHVTEQPSLVNSPRIQYETKNQRNIWSPPPLGRFKMNTDGVCRPTFVGNIFSPDGVVQRGPSGYGGILRDHHGKWVRGFLGFVGEADCLTSELHGILKGLELLVKLNLKGAILETDSQAAYEWVTRQDDYRGKSSIIDASWFIIQKCRQLINENDIVISLIHGEANRCADKLANMAIDRKEEYVEIKDCPYELMYLVGKDAEFSG